MPLRPWQQSIAVDEHLIEHAKVWSDRLSKKYVGTGPKVIEWKCPDTGQMCQVWQYGGRICTTSVSTRWQAIHRVADKGARCVCESSRPTRSIGPAIRALRPLGSDTLGYGGHRLDAGPALRLRRPPATNR